MIKHLPFVALAEFELVQLEGTDVFAVAVVRVGEVDVEPLVVTSDLQVSAEIALPHSIDLRATFGGLPFGSLDALTAARAIEIVVERVRKEARKS